MHVDAAELNSKAAGSGAGDDEIEFEVVGALAPKEDQSAVAATGTSVTDFTRLGVLHCNPLITYWNRKMLTNY